MGLRICGDVHGKFDEYYNIVKNCEYSLQLGDFGYSQTYNRMKESDLDFAHHKIFKGNHCAYDIDDSKFPFILGDFGFTKLGGEDIFYVRGAFSIDREMRLKKEWAGEWPKTWFEEEELSVQELTKAIEYYGQVKPNIVVTHDCPKVFGQYLSNVAFLRNWGFEGELKTRTQMALQVMWELHKPNKWICGHYHKSLTKTIEGTMFTCLAELEYLDI